MQQQDGQVNYFWHDMNRDVVVRAAELQCEGCKLLSNKVDNALRKEVHKTIERNASAL